MGFKNWLKNIKCKFIVCCKISINDIKEDLVDIIEDEIESIEDKVRRLLLEGEDIKKDIKRDNTKEDKIRCSSV